MRDRRRRIRRELDRRLWNDREGGPFTWWVKGWTTRDERRRQRRGRCRWRPNGTR